MMGKIKSTWRFIGMLALLTLFVATIHVQGTINIITNKPDNPDIIFLGEKNLDISRAMTDSVKTYSRIAWYETGDLNSQNPVIYPVGDPAHFYVDPDYFQGKLGNWYRYDGSASGVAFVVANPQLDVSVKNNNINLPVNDQSVYIGTPINFEVYTNLHTIRSRFGFVDATDGFLNITVYGPTGNSYNTLRDKMATILPLTYQIPIGNDWYWQPTNPQNGWFTGYRDQFGYIYQLGKYSISAVCNANDMNNNYNVLGTTVSTTKSLTILPESVTLTTNPASVLRGNTTVVTVTGTPDTDYYLWVIEYPVKMTGNSYDQPPMIVPGQVGITLDPESGPYPIGSTIVDPVAVFNNENIQIRDTVPHRPNNGVYYYAKVHTSPQGTITVQWKTNNDTALKDYFFHVQGTLTQDGHYQSADSSFTVTNGIVTLSINASANMGGIITPSGIITAIQGQNIEFSIVPDSCYAISDVIVDGVSVGKPSTYTFTNINTNHSINARFVKKEYQITSVTLSGGSISPLGQNQVKCGDSITFTIAPTSCSEISDVIVDGKSVGKLSSYTFKDVRESHIIIAQFTSKTLIISATNGPNGTISPSGQVSTSCGMNQTFTITPSNCYSISDVVVDGQSMGKISNYMFTNVQSSHTINALFEPGLYSITATASEHGTIDPSGVQNYPCGSDKTYNIFPEWGSIISDVVVDGASVGAVKSYTFPKIGHDHTISAYFNIVPSGAIRISSEPEGADIYIDGIYRLKTNRFISGIASGKHDLLLKYPFYQDYVTIIEVDPSSSITLPTFKLIHLS